MTAKIHDIELAEAYFTVGALADKYSDTKEESLLRDYNKRLREGNEIPGSAYEIPTTEQTEPWDGQNEGYITIDEVSANDALLKYARRKPPIVTGVATGKTGVIAGEPGSGKSMFALLMCCVIASGQPAMGLDPHNSEGERVLFLSLEETTNEILLRWKALCQVHNLDTGSNLNIAGMDDVVFEGTGGIEAFVNDGYRDLHEVIQRMQYKFVIIEPLSQMRLESEDNATHSLFFGVLSRICVELDTTIFIVHHLRKPPPGTQSTFDANDIRGSSTILGAVRTLIMVAKLPRMGKGIYGYKFEKCQYSLPPEMIPYTFETQIVETVWGSFGVGAIAQHKSPVSLPMPAHILEDYTTHLRTMFIDTQTYRQNIQSTEWIGHTLATRTGMDIGTGLKASERTEAQTEALERLKTDLTKLVQLGIIATDIEVVTKANRTQKRIPIYSKGSQL